MKLNIDLNTINDPVWFGDEPGGRVALRLAPDSVTEELRKKHLTEESVAVLNTESKRMEMAPKTSFDAEGYSKDLYCYSIADWDLTDVNGNQIPCTDENKLILRGVADFLKFYMESLKELRKLKGAETEDLEKNLGNSQEG